MKINFLLLLAALPLSLEAQNNRQQQLFLPLDPAVKTGRLANGFTYYIRHNERPKNRVVMYLVNKAGSILEMDDQRGLAHFTEHMSFNGTKHFPKNELVDYLQRSGVRFGADLNAYTNFDETVYQLPIPSDRPALLAGGMQIMRDWAQGATLDPLEIDKERGVVLEEKRLGKGADERMQQRYLPLILNNSRYAARLPIGTDTVLNNFRPEAIRRFYHDWYRPDLQALIIVGDVDVKKTEQAIRLQFADLKKPAHEKRRPDYAVPLSGKNRFIALTDKEAAETTAEVLIKHKAPPLKTAADYRNGIIRQLFNQMLGARYTELSLQPSPPFIAAKAGIGGFIGGLDCYTASVTAKPGELEKGFKALWRETERVKRFGFTDTELGRAKAACLSQMELALADKDKTPSESYIAGYQANFLKGAAAPGIEAEYRLTRQYLPGITLLDFNRLATEYIRAENRDILLMAPDKEKEGLPDSVTFDGWIKAVEAEPLKPYQDAVSKMPLLSKEPVPGKIVSEKKDLALNLMTLTLSNGVRVLLKPTDFDNTSIQFRGLASGGTSCYPDADYQSAAAADGLVPASGAGSYTRPQLDKYLQGKDVYVDPFIIDRSQGINGMAAPKDLETALQLVYAYFTQPRIDTALCRGMIEKAKASLANRSANPGSVFKDTMHAVLNNYNVRRTAMSVEKYNQVNFGRAYAIFRERFADASAFAFTFVGSIDTGRIRPLLEKYLGSLPSTYQNQKPRDLDLHPMEGNVTKIVRKGSEPRASVMLVYSGVFDYEPFNKIRMDAVKEVLEIRLLQRLREEESGVYAPSVVDFLVKYPVPRYELMISFGCAPQNTDKLIASVQDEVNKLRTAGPGQENVDKWRAEVKTSRETEHKTNMFWFHYLTGQLENNDDLEEVSNFDSLLNKVMPADVKDTAIKYLNAENFIRLELLPETGAKQP